MSPKADKFLGIYKKVGRGKAKKFRQNRLWLEFMTKCETRNKEEEEIEI